jgi:hypothetical protein
MKIGTDNEYIELKKLERIPEELPGAGDVNLSVSLNFQKFKGTYSGIWLEAPEIKKFIDQLEGFDHGKKNSAKITSMSPEELILEIRSSDKLEWIEIEAQLHRYQYSDKGYKYWPVYLRGGFEVPQETIPLLISCFKAFTH